MTELLIAITIKLSKGRISSGPFFFRSDVVVMYSITSVICAIISAVCGLIVIILYNLTVNIMHH